MKKKRVVSTILASIMLITTLSSCGTSANSPQQGSAAPSQSAAPSASGSPVESAATTPQGGATGELIIATENEPPTVIPGRHGTLAGNFINSMTHNGLFRATYDNLEPVPDLIESYSAINDSLWELKLIEGVKFHNGEEMTAEDVVASLKYLRTFPEAAAFQASLVDTEVVDKYTLTINTGEPNAMLFIDLTNHGNFIFPKSLIDSGHDFNASPIGTGPYMFKEWKLGDYLTFTAFDEYFDKERAPQIKDVTWRIVPEGTSRTIALEAGEIDYIVEVAAPDVPRLQQNPDVTVYLGVSTQHNHLLINNENPIFSDIRVRKALDMAIDKEAIVAVGMDGLAEPIWNQAPINFAGVSFEGENKYDPEGAKALLAEAGIDPSTISFKIIVSNDARRRMGEVIQGNLAEIGITVELDATDFATYFALTTDGEYEASIANFTSASLLTFMYSVLHNENIGGLNRSRIASDELSDLITKAISTVDESERLATIGEATKLANELTGHIPLFQAMITRAFKANLSVPETGAAGELHINMMHWLD